MPPYPNLVSDSLLINSTIDFLISLGGRAPAVEVVEYVMRINKPQPLFARLLVDDLIERDPRFRRQEDLVELIEEDHSARRLEEVGFVVFDLETTGAKAPPCRVIEIGAYLVRDGTIQGEFHSLVDPEEPVPPFITALTGISDEMVRSAPTFAEVLPGFLDFIGDGVLVAHNAQFDLAFLNYEIGKVFEDYRIANPSLCTVHLSRKLLPLVQNHKLKTLAEHYSVELINHHRAGPDARATAEIFLYLLHELRRVGVHDLAGARRFMTRKHYVKRTEAAA